MKKENRIYILIGAVLLLLWFITKSMKGGNNIDPNTGMPCIPDEQELLNEEHCGCNGMAQSDAAIGKISNTNNSGSITTYNCVGGSYDYIPCPCNYPDYNPSVRKK